jgi:putative ABC transport system permease protein
MKRAIDRVIRSLGHHDSLRSMTVEERLDSYITVQRITASIAAFFGGLAVLIAAIGVYGLAAYNVASRTAELGIRSALGAQKRDLMSLVLRESLVIAIIGCSCGVVASLGATQWIQSLISGISPNSPIVLGSIVMGLLCATVVTALRPAWRAANVDPMTTLRAE